MYSKELAAVLIGFLAALIPILGSSDPDKDKQNPFPIHQGDFTCKVKGQLLTDISEGLFKFSDRNPHLVYPVGVGQNVGVDYRVSPTEVRMSLSSEGGWFFSVNMRHIPRATWTRGRKTLLVRDSTSYPRIGDQSQIEFSPNFIRLTDAFGNTATFDRYYRDDWSVMISQTTDNETGFRGPRAFIVGLDCQTVTIEFKEVLRILKTKFE